MEVGDTVKIKKCDSRPAIAGENAKIVDLQMQEYEKYRQYPIWAKMTSGEHESKTYGFRYDEVEILPKGDETQDTSIKRSYKTMKSRVVEQAEEILKGVTAVEDIAEIERLIAEVKGKILLEPSGGFWEGKRPCWEMCQCPEMIRSGCPASKYPSFPCWEVEGTYCKLDDYGVRGDDTSICQVCRVYKRWGENKPIKIKLLGKGIDTTLKSIEMLVAKEK